MKTITLAPPCALTGHPLAAGEKDPPRLELRTPHAPPRHIHDLNARARDHTCKLFEKHGMANLGYWMPVDNPDHKLIYLLAFPSRDAARKAWKDFGADPAWKEVVKKTEANGRLVTKVESIYLAATDYSP